MTPERFIATWKNNPLTERAGAQAHFDDLCELLGVPKPRDPDNYCFERGARKAGGGDGWADVWKRGCFAWENKRPDSDLDRALKQLTDYALQLDNPPLLVVCDRERIVIHTAFTGYPDQPREILIEQLVDAEQRQLLRWVFTDPEKLRPEKSSAAITEEAAGVFAELARSMRERGLDGARVAHFLVQCLFAMFAEDERLLPSRLLTKLLANAADDPDKAARRLGELFGLMRERGGSYGDHDIAWFNGGLFQTVDVPPLTAADVAALRAAAERDWRAIDPTIFGTLFERGLDPDQRSQLGAHYTDPASIRRLVAPVVLEPLRAEWTALQKDLAARMTKAAGARSTAARTKAINEARSLLQGFLERLRNFRVLDPACGSGNFLYLSLAALRDVEKRALVESAELGLPAQLGLATGPHNVLGIEINEFAAELARVTVWIGDIQWCRRNGYRHATDPILRPLDGISRRDALLSPLPSGSGAGGEGETRAGAGEADWPDADVIVGNPPFLGDKKLLGALGDEYVGRLRACYAGRVPGGADLVTYWFEKARAQIAAGKARAAGLVATNSIRGGANRRVLERIQAVIDHADTRRTGAPHDDDPRRHARPLSPRGRGVGERGEDDRHGSFIVIRKTSHTLGQARANEFAPTPTPTGRVFIGVSADDYIAEPFLTPRIFAAWSDEPWVNAGAAVRVSLVCFGHSDAPAMLDDRPVAAIHADLTAGGASGTVDVTGAVALGENADTAFIGTQKTGAFDIPGTLARSWLTMPNPHGRPNSEVVRPWANGADLTQRPSDTWIIDFGTSRADTDACLYEQPFKHLQQYVQAGRDNKREAVAARWWLHTRPRPEMRRAMTGLFRYVATPRVAKHRFFVYLPVSILPDSRLCVIARCDDTSFGLLHSRIHECWSLATCSWHGVGNDPTYNAKSCFETFPFPDGLTPADTAGPTEILDSGVILPTVAAGSRVHALAIAEAAHRLNALRDRWLNPPEWTERIPEIVPGYPDRILPRPGHEADLKQRTLTNLYNARPAWLDQAHRALDAAVAAAYGWTDDAPDLPDDELLGRLLALNRNRTRSNPETAP